MVKEGTKDAKPNTNSGGKKARSTPLAEAGIQTGQDFAGLMSALMSDVIEGRVSAETANAACNAGGKLLKVVEMQYRYGSQESMPAQTLVLAPPRT